jgi:hypothetical protein
MTRRTHIGAMAAALAAGPALMGKEDDAMREILEASLNEKKGVVLFVKGQSVPGVVTKILADTVELRSREYSRILMRLESIDGAAMA